MNERAAFESAIDQNPLESTNHLVFADWLQEQGEHEEAEFRRSLGEWMQTRQGQRSKIKHDGSGSSTFNNTHFWWAERHQLPEGVDDRLFDRVERNPAYGPNRAEEHVSYSPSGWIHNWRTYRGMEEAFRRAFVEGRKHEESRKRMQAEIDERVRELNPDQYHRDLSGVLRGGKSETPG